MSEAEQEWEANNEGRPAPEDPRADEQPEGSDVARRVSPDEGGYQYTGD